MKTLILAGGFARRMGSIGEKTPKALLPVAGRPVIEHILERIKPLQGIGKISISTNMKFKEHFTEWMKSQKSGLDMELIIEPAMEEGQKFGSVGALKFFMQQKQVNEDMLIINGDNVFTFDLSGFLSFANGKDTLVLTAYDTKDITEAAKMGVLSVDSEGRVTDFVEKPENPKSTLVSPGIYFYPRSILPRINEYIGEGNNPDTIGYFHMWLYHKQPIMAYVMSDGKWFDIGTPDMYKKIEEELKGA